MSAKFEDAIRISLDSYAKKRAGLTKVLGNEATNHFKDSWRKQGWDDNTVKAWAKRKKKDSGRAILVKSGRLKRSFYMKVESQNRVIVENNTPYADIHNYGGSINNKGGSKVLHFRNRDNDWNKKAGKYNTGTRFSKAGKAHYSQKVNIGAYSIGMPQRKFMGKSQTLDEKSGVLISRMIKSALR
jgi:phage gpG-like protein